MWHLQPLLTPVAFVARHFGAGKVYGDRYDAIALVSKQQDVEAVLIHGTLSQQGQLSREQWRELLMKVEEQCGIHRYQADRGGQRVEFVLHNNIVTLRRIDPSTT